MRGRVQGSGGGRLSEVRSAKRRLRPAVDGVAFGVDHAAQQLRSDAQPARGAHQPHAIAAAHAAQIAQGVEHRQIVAKADHFGPQRRARLPLISATAPTGAGNPAAEIVVPTVRATLPISAVGMMWSSCSMRSRHGAAPLVVRRVK